MPEDPESSGPAIEVVESTDLSMDDLEDVAKRIREANALADTQESLDNVSDGAGDEGDAGESDDGGLEDGKDAGPDLVLDPGVARDIAGKMSVLQGFLGTRPAGRALPGLSGETVPERRADPAGPVDPPAPLAVEPSIPGFLPDGPAAGDDPD